MLGCGDGRRITPPPAAPELDANGQELAYISRENEAEARRFGRQFRM
jgi:hypothetical protein